MKLPKTCTKCTYKHCFVRNEKWYTMNDKTSYRNARHETCPLMDILAQPENIIIKEEQTK